MLLNDHLALFKLFLRRSLAVFCEVLFPTSCALCRRELEGNYPLCATCENDLPYLKKPFCETCGEHFFNKSTLTFQCSNCRGKSFHFDFALSALTFSKKSSELVHQLKYERQIHLSRILGKLLSKLLNNDERLAEYNNTNAILCPVPIHSKRERKRGFNQSLEIARFFAEESNFTMSELLKRTKHNEQQAHLNRKQRLQNLKNSFQINPRTLKKLSKNVKTVLLIDDVFTTGSTVEECSRILKKEGIQRVIVLTALRG